jgi:hypothetical protein
MRKIKLTIGLLSLFTIFAVLAVVKSAQARETPPTNIVSIETARKAATAAYPGKVKDEELEFEGGKWIYSFDLSSKKDSKIHEVHVDALTGKVLEIHTETALDEKREKQKEEKIEPNAQ